MTSQDPQALAADLERALERLGATSGSPASIEAQQLLRLVLSFHGAGLARMLEIAGRAPGGSAALVERMAADPLVASLLALHELQPSAKEPLLQILRPSDGRGRDETSRAEETCELCRTSLPAEHGHLVDIESRRLLCACPACSAIGGRYRLLPSRFVHAPTMTIAPAEWDALGIPVGLVFFVVNSRLGRTVASYPGPAGATESLLPLDAWPALVERYRWLQQLTPDVEALLVRRVDDEYRCHIVPVDACYELIGRIRKAWTGFGGGEAVEREVDRFFASVLQKAGSYAEVSP